MEAITGPHLDAWYDKNGAEIGDKCNFNYEACINLPTGSWQIQSEWSNAINAATVEALLQRGAAGSGPAIPVTPLFNAKSCIPSVVYFTLPHAFDRKR